MQSHTTRRLVQSCAGCWLRLLLTCALCSCCCGRGRLLQQEVAAVTSLKGQQPVGIWAVTGEGAEVGAGAQARGARYNGGVLQTTGDGAVGPTASSTASDTMRAARSRSGNVAVDGNTILGREVVAATYEGARAAAGSGVSLMADPDGSGGRAGGAFTGNQASFRPRHSHSRGSTAFTDTGGTSAAVAGEGNGVTALASGAEVAAFSRSHRNVAPMPGPRDGFDAAGSSST